MNVKARRPLALVAERNREVREQTAAALSSTFEIGMCEFGEDVLRWLAGGTPDVFVLGSPIYVDIGVTRRLLLQELVWRGFHDVLRRTIVATTPTPDGEVLSRARSARVFAVIAKPFDVEAVASLARACAAGPAPDHTTLWVGLQEPPGFGGGFPPARARTPSLV